MNAKQFENTVKRLLTAGVNLSVEDVFQAQHEVHSRITKAGLDRARACGRVLGRRPVRLSYEGLEAVRHLPVRAAAKQLLVSVNTYQKARRANQEMIRSEQC